MDHFKIVSQDRQKLLDILPLKKPFSVFIETTNICNFRCSVCVQGSDNTREDLKPFQHMDFGLFEKIIEELKAWPGPKLKLLRLAFHGEPFMQKNFCEYARLAVESKVAERVDTFSNGSLMDSAQAENVLDSGLDAIRFSIYSVLEKRHKEVTRSDLTVKKIQDNIRYLREERDKRGLSKPFIFVKAFDAYSEENELFVKMYKDIADKVDLEKVHDATRYKKNDLMHKYYGDADIEEKNREDFRSHLHSFIACPRPFMNLAVTSHGDCVLCTLDAPRLTKVGNLQENTLRDLWSGDKVRYFRKLHLKGQKDKNPLCRDCDWFKLFPVEDCVDGFPLERLDEF